MARSLRPRRTLHLYGGPVSLDLGQCRYLGELATMNEDVQRLFYAVDWDEVTHAIFLTEQEFCTGAEESQQMHDLIDAVNAFVEAFR